jgi:hypothetical protein
MRLVSPMKCPLPSFFKPIINFKPIVKQFEQGKAAVLTEIEEFGWLGYFFLNRNDRLLS